jgi:hypothetical protein
MPCETNTCMVCPCTYSCERRGKCCACVAYHSKGGEFPACFFSKAAERAYDRSFGALLKDRNG